MLRSFLAVLAGLLALTLVVIVGTVAATAIFIPDGLASMKNPSVTITPTATYLAANLLISLLAAVLGGWLAAWLAPRVPMAHVVALAALLVVVSVVTASGDKAQTAGQPSWYPLTIAVLGVVGVLAGGWLRTRA